jgi:EAL domain-containing protein (putative c-di-GMP-specific phosphodiesterase class I)
MGGGLKARRRRGRRRAVLVADADTAPEVVTSLAAGGVDVVAAAADPVAAGAAAAAQAVDLAVIDVATAPATMAAVVAEVRRQAPGVEVHVVVRGDRPQVEALAASAGADLVIRRDPVERRLPAHQRAALARVERAVTGDEASADYQAVVNLHTGRVVGLHAIVRFGTMLGRSQEEWLAEADAVALRHELEATIVRAAAAPVATLPRGWFVAVGVSVDALVWPPLRVAAASLPLDRLWLELRSESAVESRRGRLATLWPGTPRPQLVMAGVALSSAVLTAVAELSPDVVKVAPDLVRGIDHRPDQRAAVATLVDVARVAGAAVMADGVETYDEAVAVESVGMRFAQGSFFDRPGPLDQARLRALRRQ